MMDPNEKVAIELTRVQWNTIVQVLWKGITISCEMGMPLVQEINKQLEGNSQIKKTNNSRVLAPADD